MARSKLVGLVFESWDDLDRVLDNLDSSVAIQRLDGGSSFAWTLAHVTGMVDRWVNVRFQNQTAHGLIDQERFRFGGTGIAEDWEEIRQGVEEVRALARRYLEGLTEGELDLTLPYNGSLLPLRETGLSLRYVLLRICAHHYFHIGEIAAKRDRIGHSVGDYPSLLRECI